MPPLSRRTFLAATTAASAALIAKSAFAQGSDAPKKLGFAIVGIGSLAMNQILPAFAKAKLCKVTALVSGHPDKAAQQAAKYGVDPKNIYNYENYDTIKNNPDIDAVYIVLPNSMHAEYSIRAAKAGKHVLCEKPMANTVEECQQMIDACKTAGKKLQIAYRMRYEPMTLKAIEYAQSATSMGVLKQITAENAYNMGNPTQWRCNKAMAGGGSLMDMGIYALNAARYLTGQEPTEIAAMTYTTPNDPRFKDIEETISFELRFPSGCVASIVSSYGFPAGRFRAIGTRGQIESEPFQQYTGNRLYLGRNHQEFTYVPVDHFATQMDHLCDCITTDKPSRTPGEEGLKDLKIIMAAYESAKTGKSLKLT